MWNTKFEQNTGMTRIEKEGWKGNGQMNESQLAKKFIERLKKELPPQAVIFRHVEQFTRGVPDYSVTLGDRTVWIEFKAGEGKLSPIQKKYVRLMKNLFGVWLDSAQEERQFHHILSFLLPTRK